MKTDGGPMSEKRVRCPGCDKWVKADAEMAINKAGVWHAFCWAMKVTKEKGEASDGNK